MCTRAASSHAFQQSVVLRFVSLALIGLIGSGAAAQESSSSTPSGSVASPADALPADGPVTILEDTPLRVLTNEAIDVRSAAGMPLSFIVGEDVIVGNVLAIPRGAAIRGEIFKSKKSGALTGSPELTLKLTALQLGGRTYPLYTYLFKITGTSKARPTETKALRGAAIGAVAGGAMVAQKSGVTDTARAVNATAGAAVGAGIGTLVSAASSGPGLRIPAESEIEFQLASPITVAPVSDKEAARLAQGLHPGGPVLYVRGETP